MSRLYHADMWRLNQRFPNVTETEKSSLIKSRISRARQKLVSYWNGCAVTGFKDTNLLVASHIKPWCASNNAERLDLFNGLLLAPNLATKPLTLG